jgi:hypothetical protein
MRSLALTRFRKQIYEPAMLPIYRVRAKFEWVFLFVQLIAVNVVLLGQPEISRLKAKAVS